MGTGAPGDQALTLHSKPSVSEDRRAAQAAISGEVLRGWVCANVKQVQPWGHGHPLSFALWTLICMEPLRITYSFSKASALTL